jgi:uracil-DNA glycosylase family 4
MRRRTGAFQEALSTLKAFLQFQDLMAGRLPAITWKTTQGLGSVLAYQALGTRARECRRCGLAAQRAQVVFSSGDPRSTLLLVGEAPGVEEDALGEPFVGKAGRLLDKMLEAIELGRQDVCVTNVVKCRPPGNRDPSPEEIKACLPILGHQLDLLQPALICALGRVAAQTLLGTDAPLNALREKWHHRGSARVIATYHPAALLRNESLKRAAWQDLKRLRGLYARTTEK